MSSRHEIDSKDEESEAPIPPPAFCYSIPRQWVAYGGVCALLALQNSSYTLVRRFGHGVLKEEAPKLGWYHLYGLGSVAEEQAGTGVVEATLKRANSEVRRVKTNTKYYQSEWKGKVLVSLSVHKQDEKLTSNAPRRRALRTNPGSRHLCLCAL